MANVPLNDLSRQSAAFLAQIKDAVGSVVDSGYYILGPQVRAFEEEFSAYCGGPACVGVANGTDALEIALRALGCGPGDQVVVAPNAGGYGTLAALRIGATPVFADVDPDTHTISPASAARMVTPATKAVIATHLYGKLADVEGLRQALAGRPVAVVEDCAQAHGATRDGRRAGSLGDVAAFSFYPTKNLGALGDGGAVVTGRPELAERVRGLRQYGWARRYEITMAGGGNSRLDEMQAAILRLKLPLLDGQNEARRAIVARYQAAAAGTGISVGQPCAADYVAHLCVARHPRRAAIMEGLGRLGVDTSIHYPTLDVDQPVLAGRGFAADTLEAARRVTAEIFTLPCFPEMTPDEVDRVSAALREVGGAL